ncbi:MAG: TetR family transcriptional regulator C-terminal domain-containing protein [Lachnospiraceae bacterium]|nr:TetR family transcriptional regulator C-terminal domain-containing protein [Lachnospiraceae bacterium]
MNRIDVDGYKWDQILKDAAKWFFNEKEYLKNLLRHTNGYDSFMKSMVEIHYTALEKYILSAKGGRELTLKEKMLIKTYCLGAVGFACEWIMGQYEATPDEVAGVLNDSLPGGLKKYVINTRENSWNLSQ